MAEWRLLTSAKRIPAAVLVLLLLLSGCNGSSTGSSRPGTEAVVIQGHTFHLDVAATPDMRLQGLGGVEAIPEDGGMLFIFPEPRYLTFVMRDCLVDIDVIFLDAQGYITAMHAMDTELPRQPGESESAYENRLTSYPSSSRAQFAIELKSGWLDRLDLHIEQKIDLDLQRLKAMAE